jgi:guanylate kinase
MMEDTTKEGQLIIISGASGVGKGFVVQLLLSMSNEYVCSISATTRKPRPDEIDGECYFFVSKEDFEEMIEKGEMLEYVNYNGDYYGTPIKFVTESLARGHNVVLEIEVNGGMNIKRQFPSAILVFLTTPTYDEHVQRLRKRGTENEESIINRLRISKTEICFIKEYDYLVFNQPQKANDAARDIDAIARANRLKINSRESKIDGLIESYINSVLN